MNKSRNRSRRRNRRNYIQKKYLNNNNLYNCYWCNKEFCFEQIETDHKIPIADGGPDNKTNVVPACRDCNQFRGRITAYKIEISNFINTNNLKSLNKIIYKING